MVEAGVRRWLRLEGFALLIASALLYGSRGGNPWLYAACFFLPDLVMIGYLFNPKSGALLYNAVHSYVGPVLLGAFSFELWEAGLMAALVWAGHIAFDRMFGYGLKYPSGFGDTHLGRIGKGPREDSNPVASD